MMGLGVAGLLVLLPAWSLGTKSASFPGPPLAEGEYRIKMHILAESSKSNIPDTGNYFIALHSEPTFLYMIVFHVQSLFEYVPFIKKVLPCVILLQTIVKFI
jgi:hypothetical protein